MMKLLAAGPSPFVRKVLMTAKIKGLDDRLDLLSREHSSAAALQVQNPLGKIPTLFLADGSVLYDSLVICEYLDAQAAQPVLFPGDGPKRWQMLTRAATADGLLDAGVLIVYEHRYRPQGMQVQAWLDMQQTKIDAALAYMEAAPPAWEHNPDYSHIAIASALGYLDFRQDGKWRDNHPRMVAWLDAFRAVVPAFDETMPQAF
ncbi:MAG: glutathione S-transferase family protein [Pseudomonadota bacterium]